MISIRILALNIWQRICVILNILQSLITQPILVTNMKLTHFGEYNTESVHYETDKIFGHFK